MNPEQTGGSVSCEGQPRPPLIAIVGPTAVGKSDLALHLALTLGGEIVSADSRQVYRYLDIGTAKPTPEERARVPHHLIDVVDPNERYTLAQYQADAYRAIDGIIGRGHIPFLVGGTGLYVRAVVEGLRIPRVAPNARLRAELERRAVDEGPEALYQELQRVDPEAAAQIDWRNVRRIIRAIEVYRATGHRISELRESQAPPYEVLMIGLTIERSELYRRIDQRVDRMIAAGLVDEVQRLVDMGYGFDTPAMSGLGYRQIGAYLRGEVSLPEAVEAIKNETHRFARQQYTWFRLDDPRIRWYEARPGVEIDVERFVEAWLDSLPPWCRRH
ncbi:MAG: tRNA (adenosine(37)-N6)-dimethylallyltransferase MiaA [Chloroflexota bacterium]